MINPDNIPESPAHRRLRLLIEEHGEAKGRAKSLLLILETRGLQVTPAERTLIQSCTDPEQLSAWTRMALTATAVSELLSPTVSRRAPLDSRATSGTASLSAGRVRRRRPNGG